MLAICKHGDRKTKSQQASAFTQAVAGDTVIVLEVSRLARSTQQLCEIIERVRHQPNYGKYIALLES